MTEEKQQVIGKVTGQVIEQTSDKYKNVMRLELVQENMFTGDTETFEVKITEADDIQSNEYSAQKLQKAFDTIGEQLEVELKVPAKITAAAVQKALAPAKDKNLSVYVGENQRTNEEGDIEGAIRFYSLYEQNEITYLRSNASMKDLANALNLSTKKPFVAKPVGFSSEHNTKYFQNDQPHDAQMIEDTKTRQGLVKYFMGILNEDGSDAAKTIKKNLADYAKRNMDGDKFIGTTSGIIKSVGVFSEKAKAADDLSETTVMKLEAALSKTRTKMRVYTSSLRLLFTVPEMGADSIYQTKALKESWFNSKNETLAVTFNPHDTDFREFAKFTQPLYELGALSMDDFNEIKGMTKWFDIVNKITEVIEREGLVADLSVGKNGENYSSNLLKFRYPTAEEEAVFGGMEKPADNAGFSRDAEDEPEIPAEKQDAPAENVFATSTGPIDISDDDLPF